MANIIKMESEDGQIPLDPINLFELTGIPLCSNQVPDMTHAVHLYLTGRAFPGYDAIERWWQYWNKRALPRPWLDRGLTRLKVEKLHAAGAAISSLVQKAFITHPDMPLRTYIASNFLLTPDEVGFLLLAATLYQDRLAIYQVQKRLGLTDPRLLYMLQHGFPGE